MDGVQDKLNAKHLNETMEHIIDVVRRQSNDPAVDEKIRRELTHIFGLAQASAAMTTITLTLEPARLLARGQVRLAQERLRRQHGVGKTLLAELIGQDVTSARLKAVLDQLIMVAQVPYEEALEEIAAAHNILKRVQDFVLEAADMVNAGKDMRPKMDAAVALAEEIMQQFPEISGEVDTPWKSLRPASWPTKV